MEHMRQVAFATALRACDFGSLASVGLIAWKSQLDEERIVRIEAWRLVKPEEPSLGTKQSRRVDVAVREGFFRHRHRPGWDRGRDVG
jgi:hypothetical protein